jgi:winged helix DNA-binding protein
VASPQRSVPDLGSEDDIRRRRLRAQRLADAPPASPAETVRALVALQAQDRRAVPLAIRARAPGASAEAVEHALSGDRSLVRTWAMRGTMHLLAAEDLPLALAIFAPVQQRRGEPRLAGLRLPPDVVERGVEAAAAVLADDGPLTRHELAARLRDLGVPVPAEGQAPIHMVHRAAIAGVLCEVGVRGAEPLYGRLDPGPLPDRDAALKELARRYAAAHAPADADDFATWSGLPAADVRRAWDDVVIDDDPAEAGGVRLLPAFDEWLLGWASRDFTLAPQHVKRPLPGGGIVRPVAIADGRVFATWRLDRPRRRVEVESFGRVGRAVRAGLDEEIAAVLDFVS